MPSLIASLSDVEDKLFGKFDVHVIVAAHRLTDEPDLFFLKVRCTQPQFDACTHLEKARKVAKANGYDTDRMVIFDEQDPAGKAMMGLFEWVSATTYDVDDLREPRSEL